MSGTGRIGSGCSGWFFSEKGVYTPYTQAGIALRRDSSSLAVEGTRNNLKCVKQNNVFTRLPAVNCKAFIDRRLRYFLFPSGAP